MKHQASYTSGLGDCFASMPGPASSACICLQHLRTRSTNTLRSCNNSWLQNYCCVVWPRHRSSHFLPYLLREFSGKIDQGSLQQNTSRMSSSRSVHKKCCHDWSCHCNRRNGIYQSLRSELTTILLPLHVSYAYV